MEPVPDVQLTSDQAGAAGHLLQEDHPLALVCTSQDDAHRARSQVLLQLQLLGLPRPEGGPHPLGLSAQGIGLLGKDWDLPHLAILQLDLPQLQLQ